MEKIEVEVSGTIKHEGVSQQKVEVTRYQKGGYGWVISATGADLPSILSQIKLADTQLKADFPQTEGG